MLLRSVNDTSRKVFAFQMMAKPEIDSTALPTESTVSDSPNVETTQYVAEQPQKRSDGSSVRSETITQEILSNDSILDMGSGFSNEGSAPALLSNNDNYVPGKIDTDLSRTDLSLGDDNDLFISETGMSSSQEVNMDSSENNLMDFVETDMSSNVISTSPEIQHWNNGSPVLPDNTPKNLNLSSERIEGWDSGLVDITTANPSDQDAMLGQVLAADQWKSCAICLEDLMDAELMIHTKCGGTFCQTCLEVGLHIPCFLCYYLLKTNLNNY